MLSCLKESLHLMRPTAVTISISWTKAHAAYLFSTGHSALARRRSTSYLNRKHAEMARFRVNGKRVEESDVDEDAVFMWNWRPSLLTRESPRFAWCNVQRVGVDCTRPLHRLR
jgi:hypothetical protein